MEYYRGFLISCGKHVQELLDSVLLPAAVAIIKFPGNSKLHSLQTKGNHFAKISAKCYSQGTNNSTSVVIQRDVPPNDNLELEMSSHWPQKRRNKTGNFITIVLIKGTLAWAQ